MATEQKSLQNFNLDTMSGIYPGSRTMTYQRLYLRGHNEVAISKAGHSEAKGEWYQLQWYSEPDAARMLPATNLAAEPVVTLENPLQGDFNRHLHSQLAAIGLQADACFACRHWQRATLHTADGLPAGRCGWSDQEAALPDAIAIQSALSLACPHYLRVEQPLPAPSGTQAPALHPRVPKSAELDPDRLPFWPRLWHHLRHRLPHSSQTQQHWAAEIIERSGVGAGTEPCFVCQGRLANLGALAVASPEGDKQTLSVWRCRSCYTTYFNDWTDRWERLENLETEERYFRIAPAEAYAALRIIHATQGGEHPGRRHDRRQQRAQMLAIVADKEPLRHQIRQGR